MSDAYYLQLTEQLRALIDQNASQWEGKLPAERSLAERFATTRVTLRQALSQLEGEGLIHRSNRRGWFISPARLVYDPTRDAGFNDYVRAQGRQPRTAVLKLENRLHPPAARALGLPDDQPFHHIRRRRYVDDRAVLVESLWVVPERAPELLDIYAGQSLWGHNSQLITTFVLRVVIMPLYPLKIYLVLPVYFKKAFPQVGIFFPCIAFFLPTKNPAFGNGVNNIFGIGHHKY